MNGTAQHQTLIDVMDVGLKRSRYIERKIEIAKRNNYPEDILKKYDKMWHDNNAKISRDVDNKYREMYGK